MREIKFRGIPIDEDCEWNIITGSLLVDTLGNAIIYHPLNTSLGGFRAVPVNPETVGQFTGFKDKNGVEIYENDLLKVPFNDYILEGTHVVYCFSDGFVTSSIKFANRENANKNCLSWIINRGAFVIGNVHENPELL